MDDIEQIEDEVNVAPDVVEVNNTGDDVMDDILNSYEDVMGSNQTNNTMRSINDDVLKAQINNQKQRQSLINE